MFYLLARNPHFEFWHCCLARFVACSLVLCLMPLHRQLYFGTYLWATFSGYLAAIEFFAAYFVADLQLVNFAAVCNLCATFVAAASNLLYSAVTTDLCVDSAAEHFVAHLRLVISAAMSDSYVDFVAAMTTEPNFSAVCNLWISFVAATSNFLYSAVTIDSRVDSAADLVVANLHSVNYAAVGDS